jgi:hypothetical protein
MKPSFQKFPEIKQLKNKTINIDQKILLSSNRILFIDSILIILEGKNDSYLYLFNPNNGKLLGNGGIKGQGPGELIAPWLLVDNYSTNSFGVFDLAVQRYVNFSIDSLKTNGNYRPKTYFNFMPEVGFCNYPAWICDSILVTPGSFSSGRLAFINSKGKLIKRVGSVPNKRVNVTNELALQAYQSVMTVNLQKKLIAVCSRYADRMEIYTIDGEEKKVVTGPDGFLPKYSIGSAMGNPVMILDKKTRFGFIDVVSDENFIYALYSGKSRVELPGKANFGNFIFKFDWEGNPIALYKLDELLLAITFDKKNKIIYGIKQEENESIIAYQF